MESYELNSNAVKGNKVDLIADFDRIFTKLKNDCFQLRNVH